MWADLSRLARREIGIPANARFVDLIAWRADEVPSPGPYQLILIPITPAGATVLSTIQCRVLINQTSDFLCNGDQPIPIPSDQAGTLQVGNIGRQSAPPAAVDVQAFIQRCPTITPPLLTLGGDLIGVGATFSAFRFARARRFMPLVAFPAGGVGTVDVTQLDSLGPNVLDRRQLDVTQARHYTDLHRDCRTVEIINNCVVPIRIGASFELSV